MLRVLLPVLKRMIMSILVVFVGAAVMICITFLGAPNVAFYFPCRFLRGLFVMISFLIVILPVWPAFSKFIISWLVVMDPVFIIFLSVPSVILFPILDLLLPLSLIFIILLNLRSLMKMILRSSAISVNPLWELSSLTLLWSEGCPWLLESFVNKYVRTYVRTYVHTYIHTIYIHTSLLESVRDIGPQNFGLLYFWSVWLFGSLDFLKCCIFEFFGFWRHTLG